MIGGIAGILMAIGGFFIFFKSNPEAFYFILGLSFITIALPFVASLMIENKKEKDNNEMFLEFSRNLVESVKAGTPISKSIINLRYKNYGSLSPNIEKLANQISIGIPVKEALQIFARDVNSKMVSRSITLISEAERAGGEIEGILESVAKSVGELENLKKERKSAIYNLVVQGYVIFFVFIVIMLVMQFKILPMTSGIAELGKDSGGVGNIGLGIAVGNGFSADEMVKPMLYLLLLQGFFTGVVIGKLAEGNFKAGIKHSFVMVAMSAIIYTGAKLVFK